MYCYMIAFTHYFIHFRWEGNSHFKNLKNFEIKYSFRKLYIVLNILYSQKLSFNFLPEDYFYFYFWHSVGSSCSELMITSKVFFFRYHSFNYCRNIFVWMLEEMKKYKCVMYIPQQVVVLFSHKRTWSCSSLYRTRNCYLAVENSNSFLPQKMWENFSN